MLIQGYLNNMFTPGYLKNMFTIGYLNNMFTPGHLNNMFTIGYLYNMFTPGYLNSYVYSRITKQRPNLFMILEKLTFIIHISHMILEPKFQISLRSIQT